MKKLILLIYVYLSLFFFVKAKVIVNKNIGKITRVKLKKKMIIKGTGKGYYLKLPVSIKVDDKGNIYILDGDSGGWRFYEILKFNNIGKFERRIVSRGQGPGEAFDIGGYFISNNKIYIYDYSMKKMIVKDLYGNIMREFRIRISDLNLQKRISISFISVYKKKFYFSLVTTDFATKKTSIINEDNFYCIYSGSSWKIGRTNFPTLIYFIRGSNGVPGIIPIGSIKKSVYKSKYLFINNTAKYLIKLYDIEKDRVILSFKREYRRIKNMVYNEKEEGGVKIAGIWYYKPHQKYYDDIQKLLIRSNKLWVLTSTTDRKRGVLTDVFNDKGLFINKFYLELKNKTDYSKINDIPMVISGNYLYTIERDKNDEPVIIKYEIPEKENL